jgi:hypothetical protein
MDELEGQLLAKVLALEKERVALSHGSHQQRQEVEKELDALQDRVAELEHGGSWGEFFALSRGCGAWRERLPGGGDRHHQGCCWQLPFPGTATSQEWAVCDSGLTFMGVFMGEERGSERSSDFPKVTQPISMGSGPPHNVVWPQKCACHHTQTPPSGLFSFV